MLSEDIEPESHLTARLMATNAYELNGYTVTPSFIKIKYAEGIPNDVVPPRFSGEYKHEADFKARKEFDNGLVEEIFVEIGNEDDWDTMHSPANSSKYVYNKQKENDEIFESWVHQIKPDAIIIRPSKGEILTFANAPEELFRYLNNLKRKYIKEFVLEQSSTK